MFEKVLVANRGEIAIRVMRALKEMGIASVGVYSEADREAPHVREADEAFLLGPAVPAESYLNIEKIIEVAKRGRRRGGPSRLRLPGRERRLREAPATRPGIVFIGPPAEAIEAMGSKTQAREIMQEAGVPIVPGATEPAKDVEAAAQDRRGDRLPGRLQGRRRRRRQGLPRRADRRRARGGVRGRRPRGREVLLRRPRLPRALPRGPAPRRGPGARRLARQRDPPRRARLLDPAPPSEADRGGARARTSTRRCASGSARSPPRPPRAVDYRGAGTVEGMQVGEDYFFLEMNTRVQVEHCVTEMVTGIDIVREQVRIAAGEELSIAQDDVELRGHAIECRINAEAAHKNFAPAPGHDRRPTPSPPGPGVRVDSGLEAGSEVTPALRPDGREADRLGRRPRAGDAADAARARRVRDRAA